MEIPDASTVRDKEYERLYLERVVDEAERRFGVLAGSYASAVKRRLTLGAERYNDNFMTKDNMVELLEETPDVAAYALLETQKQLHSGVEISEDRIYYLHEAAVFAAAADYYVRQAKRAG